MSLLYHHCRLGLRVSLLLALSGGAEAAAAAPEQKPAAEANAASAALLAAPAVLNQNRESVSSLSIATLRAGSRVHVSLKEAMTGLPAVSEWTIYFVELAAGEIKWSATGKGPPPDTVEWGGLMDDGEYPAAGKTYAFKAVLRVAGAYRKTAARDVTVAVVSTDVVEINSVSQRIGLGAYRFAADNDQKIPQGLLGYVESRVILGDLVMLEMNLMKDVKSTTYEPTLLGEKVTANLSVGEFIASLSLRRGAFRGAIGGGIFYQKANVKFLSDGSDDPAADAPEGEETTELQDPPAEGETVEVQTATQLSDRDKLQAPAVAVGLEYFLGDFTIGTHASASFSKLGAHTAYGLSADYMLTRTWYVGTNVSFVRIGKSDAGDPGSTLASAGLHIGFDVRRNADE